MTSPNDTWLDFLREPKNAETLKSYVHLKVGLPFDSTTTHFILDGWKKSANRFLWKLNSLELVFDPYAYGEQDPAIAQWWDLDVNGTFPPEALVGDLGFNSTNGSVWRKT